MTHHPTPGATSGWGRNPHRHPARLTSAPTATANTAVCVPARWATESTSRQHPQVRSCTQSATHDTTRVDDVRISRRARYSRNFAPAKRLARDSTTLLALANDQMFGPFVPVASGAQLQATVKGNANLLRADR